MSCTYTDLRKRLTKERHFTSTMNRLKNAHCKLIRDLLEIVIRNKDYIKRKRQIGFKFVDKGIIEQSIGIISEQSERLQKNLRWLFLQNKKNLDDNRCIVNDVMKLKYENVRKLNDVFTCALSVLYTLDNKVKSSNKQEHHAFSSDAQSDRPNLNKNLNGCEKIEFKNLKEPKIEKKDGFIRKTCH